MTWQSVGKGLVMKFVIGNDISSQGVCVCGGGGGGGEGVCVCVCVGGGGGGGRVS